MPAALIDLEARAVGIIAARHIMLTVTGLAVATAIRQATCAILAIVGTAPSGLTAVAAPVTANRSAIRTAVA